MNEPDLSIPAGLFKSASSTQHTDRYVVYKMINRMVSFRDPSSGTKVSGYVEEVYRDIFSGEIRITVRGRTFRLKEPESFREDDHGIVCIYGDKSFRDVSDKKLFAAMRQEQFRETVSDTMRRMAPRRIKELRFTLGDKKPSRRRHVVPQVIPEAVPMAAAAV